MPPVLATTLAAVVVAALLGRVRALLRTRRAVASPADTALGVLGSAGLLAHCTAMFYRGLAHRVPGAGGYIAAVNAFGWASVVLYAVPAALLVGAVRRRSGGLLAAMVAGVAAVGVTMYDDGALWLHLCAITALTLLIAWVASPLSQRVS